MKFVNNDTKRILGYAGGFILFFGPFALFQRAILFLLGRQAIATIHTLCLRIPIEKIISGDFFHMGTVSVISTIILIIVAFFFGPLFCGKLCPVGALPEYLSKLVPNSLKIEWAKYLPMTSLRAGFLLGFLIAPIFGGYLACSYCNYYVFDLFVNYIFWGYTVAFSGSLILTGILWFFIFGIFTKGGRGFCNLFCPVGALQALLYVIAAKLGLNRELQINYKKCIGCGSCAKVCPMNAVQLIGKAARISIYRCILCSECFNKCPTGAIFYARKARNIDEQ